MIGNFALIACDVPDSHRRNRFLPRMHTEYQATHYSRKAKREHLFWKDCPFCTRLTGAIQREFAYGGVTIVGWFVRSPSWAGVDSASSLGRLGSEHLCCLRLPLGRTREDGVLLRAEEGRAKEHSSAKPQRQVPGKPQQRVWR